MEQHLGTINFQALEECENNICQALLDWFGCCLCNEKRRKRMIMRRILIEKKGRERREKNCSGPTQLRRVSVNHKITDNNS